MGFGHHHDPPSAIAGSEAPLAAVTAIMHAIANPHRLPALACSRHARRAQSNVPRAAEQIGSYVLGSGVASTPRSIARTLSRTNRSRIGLTGVAVAERLVARRPRQFAVTITGVRYGDRATVIIDGQPVTADDRVRKFVTLRVVGLASLDNVTVRHRHRAYRTQTGAYAVEREVGPGVVPKSPTTCHTTSALVRDPFGVGHDRHRAILPVIERSCE